MPDISMCAQKECPKAKTCYRLRVRPSEYSQSYFVDNKYTDEGCHMYVAIAEADESMLIPWEKILEMNVWAVRKNDLRD